MMNKKEKIEQEIRKTLNHFEHAEKLSQNPYFYTRLQQRLEEKNKNIFDTVLKPALLTGLVAINLVTAVWYFSGDDQQVQSTGRQALLEILASDLQLDNEQNNIISLD
jgi:hypothetical protein